MAKLPRFTLAGMPVHVIQLGNNRQVCLASDGYHIAYTGWLKEYSKKCEVTIYAQTS